MFWNDDVQYIVHVSTVPLLEMHWKVDFPEARVCCAFGMRARAQQLFFCSWCFMAEGFWRHKEFVDALHSGLEKMVVPFWDVSQLCFLQAQSRQACGERTSRFFWSLGGRFLNCRVLRKVTYDIDWHRHRIHRSHRSVLMCFIYCFSAGVLGASGLLPEQKVSQVEFNAHLEWDLASSSVRSSWSDEDCRKQLKMIGSASTCRSCPCYCWTVGGPSKYSSLFKAFQSCHFMSFLCSTSSTVVAWYSQSILWWRVTTRGLKCLHVGCETEFRCPHTCYNNIIHICEIVATSCQHTLTSNLQHYHVLSNSILCGNARLTFAQAAWVSMMSGIVSSWAPPTSPSTSSGSATGSGASTINVWTSTLPHGDWEAAQAETRLAQLPDQIDSSHIESHEKWPIHKHWYALMILDACFQVYIIHIVIWCYGILWLYIEHVRIWSPCVLHYKNLACCSGALAEPRNICLPSGVWFAWTFFLRLLSYSVSSREIFSLRPFRHFHDVVFIDCLVLPFLVPFRTCGSSRGPSSCAHWAKQCFPVWNLADHWIQDGCRTKGVDWRTKCQLWGRFAAFVCQTSRCFPWPTEPWDGPVCFASGLRGCSRLECEWPGGIQLAPKPQCLNTSTPAEWLSVSITHAMSRHQNN